MSFTWWKDLFPVFCFSSFESTANWGLWEIGQLSWQFGSISNGHPVSQGIVFWLRGVQFPSKALSNFLVATATILLTCLLYCPVGISAFLLIPQLLIKLAKSIRRLATIFTRAIAWRIELKAPQTFTNSSNHRVIFAKLVLAQIWMNRECVH